MPPSDPSCPTLECARRGGRPAPARSSDDSDAMLRARRELAADASRRRLWWRTLRRAQIKPLPQPHRPSRNARSAWTSSQLHACARCDPRCARAIARTAREERGVGSSPCGISRQTRRPYHRSCRQQFRRARHPRPRYLLDIARPGVERVLEQYLKPGVTNLAPGQPREMHWVIAPAISTPRRRDAEAVVELAGRPGGHPNR